MLKKYKNQLFNFLKDSQFGLEAFKIWEGNNGQFDTTTLVYKETELYFKIIQSPSEFNSFSVEYKDFSPKNEPIDIYPHFYQMDVILKYIDEWFKDINN